MNSDSGCLARAGLEGAVRDAVVHRVQIGQIEQVAHQQPALRAQVAFDVVVLGEREVHRDRLRAGAHLERDVMVLQEQPELLEVVVREQVWPGQRRFVGAWPGNEAVTQARVGARDRIGVDSHERVTRAHARRAGAARNEVDQRRAQVRDAGFINRTHLGQRGGWIGEAGRGHVIGNEWHGAPCRYAIFVAFRDRACPTWAVADDRCPCVHRTPNLKLAGHPPGRPLPSEGLRPLDHEGVSI